MQEVSKETESAEDIESAKVLAKYKKMLKIGMPRQSVINRMRQDAVSVAVIAKLFPDAPEGQKSVVQNGEDGPTAEQDLKLKKYRKMLKIHMPPQSVINRMVQDQMGPDLIRFLFPDAPEAVSSKAVKSQKVVAKKGKDAKGALLAAVKSGGGFKAKAKVAAQPKDEEKVKEPPKPKVLEFV